MAQRDANKVQLDFPQLTADLIAALKLTGTLGVLDLSDVVIPTISVGNVRPQTFTFEPVVFDSAEIFSFSVASPAVNTVLLDTGALAAGVYDLIYGFSFVDVGVVVDLQLQWRNAANAANLATWPTRVSNLAGAANTAPIGPFGVNIGLNERLRVQNVIGGGAGQLSGYIQLALRPTP